MDRLSPACMPSWLILSTSFDAACILSLSCMICVAEHNGALLHAPATRSQQTLCFATWLQKHIHGQQAVESYLHAMLVNLVNQLQSCRHLVTVWHCLCAEHGTHDGIDGDDGGLGLVLLTYIQNPPCYVHAPLCSRPSAQETCAALQNLEKKRRNMYTPQKSSVCRT